MKNTSKLLQDIKLAVDISHDIWYNKIKVNNKIIKDKTDSLFVPYVPSFLDEFLNKDRWLYRDEFEWIDSVLFWYLDSLNEDFTSSRLHLVQFDYRLGIWVNCWGG